MRREWIVDYEASEAVALRDFRAIDGTTVMVGMSPRYLFVRQQVMAGVAQEEPANSVRGQQLASVRDYLADREAHTGELGEDQIVIARLADGGIELEPVWSQLFGSQTMHKILDAWRRYEEIVDPTRGVDPPNR